ncbi:MAG: hypothetical protein NUV52_04810, partial [Candidatus Roizmanbacteria bacterium]|nr:hypothetical protein [Candidatus Roizmanbacteria bacterium]
MHKRNKSPQSKPLLIGLSLGILIIGIIVWRFIATSSLLSNRERVTVGVYTTHPFVVSYNKHSSIVTVIWFNPRARVYVPGGYQWYPFGSVLLLDSIEKKKGALVRRTFEELVGAPVDFVVTPRSASTLSTASDSFVTFFYRERGRLLPWVGGSYRISSGNSIDGSILSNILRSRNDKLLFVDASSATTAPPKKADGLRYDSDKLDQVLKGYLYWPSIDLTNNVRLEIGDSTYYGAAQRIGRMIEGMGIKVIDISVTAQKKNTDADCIVYFGAQKKQ